MIKPHLLRYLGLAAACLVPTHALAQASVDKDDLVQAMGLKPGRWHTTFRVTSADLVPLEQATDALSNARSKLREKIGFSTETEDCIGKGPDRDGNLILPGINIGATCAFNRIDARDGRLNLSANCGDAAGGFGADLDIQATYSSATMTTEIESRTSSKKGGYLITMTMEMTSRHDGLCKLPTPPPTIRR